MKRLLPPALVATTLMYLACGSGGGGGFVDGPDSGGFETTDARVDLPDGQSSTEAGGTLPTVGTLVGKVLAPEGTIPISDALVYLTKNAPTSIPSGVFCDSCVQLTGDEGFAFSAADGSVTVPVRGEGQYFLVVQKGQFRRVRQVNVTKGVNTPNKGLLQLPGKTDAALGDTIPRMFIARGAWDKIEDSLKKLGITGFDTDVSCNDSGIPIPFLATCGADDISADRLYRGANDSSGKPFIDRYQIVFSPCNGDTGGAACTTSPATSSKVRDNVRRWVKAGGKLYVTDWNYEMVRQTWPGYIDFAGATNTIGSACGGEYDAPATWNDPNLNAWMTAIGESSATLKGNWTRINSVKAQQGEDFQGNPKTITPVVWATASGPATVTFPDRCGRVLFSTYHTEGSGDSTLLAQEKALLYVLLEVGVCVGPRPDGQEK